MDSENKIAVIIRITANVEKSRGLDEHSARGFRHAEDVRSRVPLRFTLGF
jgi:hypothetical protein